VWSENKKFCALLRGLTDKEELATGFHFHLKLHFYSVYKYILSIYSLAILQLEKSFLTKFGLLSVCQVARLYA